MSTTETPHGSVASTARTADTVPQMCTVDDIIGGDPCLRVAQHEWHLLDDDHPLYLCNFHAEPFEPFPASRPWPYDGEEGRGRLTGNYCPPGPDADERGDDDD